VIDLNWRTVLNIKQSSNLFSRLSQNRLSIKYQVTNPLTTQLNFLSFKSLTHNQTLANSLYGDI